MNVPNLNDNTVSVIVTGTNTVTTAIPVGSHPLGLQVSPDGARVYVADQNAAAVNVIDTATDVVIATIGVGSLPQGVAVSLDSSAVYITNQVTAPYR